MSDSISGSEAGLILMPLLSSGEVRRLLVLCPASLVGQWQYRLRTMFDIRLTAYSPDADTLKADFWNTQNQVVASVQTLRADRHGRHKRLEEADPWDMVVVDEAHHLNAVEGAGATLGYALVEKLSKAGRIRSMVFFSGTPHRGKDYGFLTLLKLLRPDLFDTRRPLDEQLGHLPRVMIRNNKQQVTDLAGNRLFQEPLVRSETYAYSPAETAFYHMLSDFILTGKAYAGTLSQGEGRAVMLVLIAMQKLASSSVAAIRRALVNRLNRTILGQKALTELQAELARATADEDLDAVGRADERLAETADGELQLIENEVERLRELLAAADAVTDETKINKILELVDGPFAGRSVLFFTEYKATQSLLLSRLLQRFGPDSATFINGDERADEVNDGTGPRTLVEPRERAAERFTGGQVRFLVSTEAGGEGIDLQANCSSLIHVDLPWNPMRLHQRVGRLNRYGQSRRVEVFTVRNPDTVEARIWDLLNAKIERITASLRQVMADPEDVLQLVLGMASSTIFNDLFGSAGTAKPESLRDYFDERTRTFGGEDALHAARRLGMNAAKFDFQQASALVPRIDLPALKPFFKLMLQLNQRKVKDDETGLSFLTPDKWQTEPGVAREYSAMLFDRSAGKKEDTLGIGHKLVDQAVAQARGLTASVGPVLAELLPHPLAVFRITDRVTGRGGVVRAVTAAVDLTADGFVLLRDWELVVRLNAIVTDRDPRRFRLQATTDPADTANRAEEARGWLTSHLTDLDPPFQVPEVTLTCLLLPGTRSAPDAPATDE